jgi:hypothetical protein|tara:strand:+ start:4795 stop:5565 length:771 start_codon:yes stop_codon:yes gene_type:complete
MALETGTYIDSLVVANPAATDALSQADEHLKLLKSTIKATFPNVDAAVTATPTDLNTKTALVSDGTDVTFNTGITADKVKTLIGITEPVAPAITTATDSEGEVTPVLSTGITAVEVWGLVKSAALDSIYPVGAIYTAITSGSPATVFGGTWVSFGQGRVMVGHDDAAEPDTDFVAPSGDGSSVLLGGAKTHTLSIAEIPSHTHGFTAHQTTSGSNNRTGGGALSASASGTTAATGDGGAHNNLQPYVVVYMWKRTV